MSIRDITRDRTHDYYILPPLIIMLILWTIGILHWFAKHDVLTVLFFGYLGLIIGAGIGGYIASKDRYRPYARRLVIMLLGSLLLAVAFITDHGNMQMEGLLFALVAGGGAYIILHFVIAKFVGPLIFGRIWCGWACWYAMVFDLLPYPFSNYHRPWGWVRYAHLGILIGLVVVLWFGFGVAGLDTAWFAVGLLAYYAVGIALAFILKDNRAFCKYLCPIAVPLKLTSQFSLLKVSGIADHCEGCEVCVEMCPMDIRVRDYIAEGSRVLSTECTLCQTCISACPHDSLQLAFALDRGGKEYTDYDRSPGNRDTKASSDDNLADWNRR